MPRIDSIPTDQGLCLKCGMSAHWPDAFCDAVPSPETVAELAARPEPTAAELRPGMRKIEGRWYYSAAWL